jgi:hypothetical protein
MSDEIGVEIRRRPQSFDLPVIWSKPQNILPLDIQLESAIIPTSSEDSTMSINTSELWVVVYIHTDPYSFDTGMPDTVYLKREEAEAACCELNSMPKTFSWERENPYSVESLYDRMLTIREESRREGERDERRNADGY